MTYPHVSAAQFVAGGGYAFNAYNSDTGWKHIAAGFAGTTYLDANGGAFGIGVWPSGAAGSAVSGGMFWTFGQDGTLNCPGKIVSTSVSFANDPNFNIAQSGQYRIFNYTAGWYWSWNTNGGDLIWVMNNTYQWYLRASDALAYNATAGVGGYGPYSDFSDARGKRDVAKATEGLDVIRKLNPVSFTRVPRNKQPPRRELGFIAQDVRPVLPEAIHEIGIELEDGSGGLASDSPTLALMTTAIIAALCNAAKELDARMSALEATR
jgi:hypothetical protein